MGFFTTEFSEPSLISSFINKSQHVSHLLFTMLGASMIKIFCPDPSLVDPGIQPYANKRNNQWTVSPGIYSNNKSPLRSILWYQYFTEHPSGNPALTIKITILIQKLVGNFYVQLVPGTIVKGD